MSQTVLYLTEDQTQKADEFKKNHDCKYRTQEIPDHIYVGEIGGTTSYRFTPTSLGVVAVVLCTCGNEMELTDHESW